MVKNEQPTCIIGAVGVVPNCFTREVVEAMVESVTEVEHDGSQVQGGRMSQRPIIFALSNPKTQAEVTAENCYKWSDGKAIYGSGTQFDPVTHNGRTSDTAAPPCPAHPTASFFWGFNSRGLWWAVHPTSVLSTLELVASYHCQFVLTCVVLMTHHIPKRYPPPWAGQQRLHLPRPFFRCSVLRS